MSQALDFTFLLDTFDPSAYGTEQRFRLSRNNRDCRNPAYWHSRNSTATEIEVIELLVSLTRALQPELVLETGGYRGFTSYCIGRALQRNGHGRLISIENHVHLHRYARARCRDLPVDCIRASSLDYIPASGASFDMIFFDTDFAYRLKEFDHFRPWMNPATILTWHDTGTQHRIRPYLDQLVAQGTIDLVYLPTPRGFGIARLRAPNTND